MKDERRARCWVCGADMGPWRPDSDRHDTCGKRECEREKHEAEQIEYRPSQMQIDDDAGLW